MRLIYVVPGAQASLAKVTLRLPLGDAKVALITYSGGFSKRPNEVPTMIPSVEKMFTYLWLTK